jgi:deoxyribodipyrimidine photolyase-related protein
MESFYRRMRKCFDVLMDDKGKPTGVQWNFDQRNRQVYNDKVPVPQTLFGMYQNAMTSKKNPHRGWLIAPGTGWTAQKRKKF